MCISVHEGVCVCVKESVSMCLSVHFSFVCGLRVCVCERKEGVSLFKASRACPHHFLTFCFQLAVIYNSCSANTIRRALFSATFANDVKMFCKETMDNVVQVNIGARSVCRVTVVEGAG